MNNYTWTAIAIVALLIGGAFGAVLFPVEKEVVRTETITEEVKVNVPVVETVYQNEVLKEQAIEDFLEHMEDEELFICDSEEYSESEVEVSRIYDEYAIVFDEDETQVYVKVKLKYKESDLRSCRERYEFDVLYEEDEDALVTIA